jgi:rhodanese-related sulfurtransferase
MYFQQFYLTCLSPRAGATFPHVAVHEGDEIRFGRVILRFLETPGHTIESVSICDLDHDRPIAVHCKGGYRSAIAASLIQRAGFENVMNVIGGFDAWRACGLPAV